jgi:hypothetical protein
LPFCHFLILHFSFVCSFVRLYSFRRNSTITRNFQFNENHYLCILIEKICGSMSIDENKL